MKKRIGSKLYDTESAELIADTVWGKIYRKRTRAREWFIVYHSPDEMIEPLTDAEARAMLGESSYNERPPESKRIMIGVDRETHSRIAKAAAAHGVSISEEIRRMAESNVI